MIGMGNYPKMFFMVEVENILQQAHYIRNFLISVSLISVRWCNKAFKGKQLNSHLEGGVYVGLG
jgi:hypothetical protein